MTGTSRSFAQELLKYTPERHPERPDLETALQMVSEAASHCNLQMAIKQVL